MKTKSRSEIDEYIGARIREGRLSLNLSQEQLARALGVSFQQVQNYEKGVNGVSAVRLFDICKILNVSLASMFPQDHPKHLPHPFARLPLDHPKQPCAGECSERSGMAAQSRFWPRVTEKVPQPSR
jgi:transcriptional regulator with XRE-family HTH domain